MNAKFESLGRQYEVDGYGVIHHMDAKPYKYDKDYISTYSKPQYKDNSNKLSMLRLSFLVGALGHMPSSIFDFGFGDGSFINLCSRIIPTVYGYDITGLPVPEGCEEVKGLVKSEVYTFWDTLEHTENMSFIEGLDCKVLAISLPYCHEHNSKWFDDWRHRKPDEHLHHFNDKSLESYFMSKGWSLIAISHIEDLIRKPDEGAASPNILSACFIKL